MKFLILRIIPMLMVIALVSTTTLALAAAATRSETDVRTFPGPGAIVEGGSSTLTRNDNGVSMTFKSPDLEPGHAYTMWWIVFNDPDDCQFPMMDGGVNISKCGVDDLKGRIGNPSQLLAAGNVVGNNGRGNFAAHLAEGDFPDASMPGHFGPGLVDSYNAEIHLISRSHGPAIPGLVDEQIHTLMGGCNPGEPNEGVCFNHQFAAHMP